MVRAVSVTSGHGTTGRSCGEGQGPSILVRGLDPKTVQRLKAQARVNGRSLEQEIQEILERAARMLIMREAGKPVGYSRAAAGEGHAGLPWGGRGITKRRFAPPTLLARLGVR